MSQSHSTMELMGTPSGLYHWIPGEMIVVVRLPRLPLEGALGRVTEQIHAQLNEFLASYKLSLEMYGTAGRWSKTPGMPPVRRRSFIFGLHRKQPLLALFFHTRHQDARITDPLPMALTYLQSHLTYFAQRGLHIVSAMPNWLVTSASLYYGQGGPAIPPGPAPIINVAAPPNALPGWHIHFKEQGITQDAKGTEDIVVAVLDTAHHPDRIRSAATRPELRQNWLVQKLASDLRHEDGSFFVEYDRYPLSNDVRTGRNSSGESRYYFMPDHGLAVAGIVRDIAPRARVRLIRVLNDYGGGDLYALFSALTDLERELVSGTIRRLVINLSLTIMPDIRRLPYIWLDQKQWPTTQLPGVMRVLNHIEEGLRLLFESLYAHGALVVAAAGNDSFHARQQGHSPRSPRAPARYETTLAVSAVNSWHVASNFTNAANIPPLESGVATFGGDGHGCLADDGLPDAVRGMYISPTFPSGEQNATGWADWRGTSFAAPIVSSLAALLMGQGWSAGNIISRLSARQEQKGEMLFGTPPEVPDLLANVIRVQQRFGL